MKPLTCLLALSLALPVSAAERPWFTDVTARAGLDWTDVNGVPDQVALVDQNGQGIAVLDYDRDGRPDLFFPNGSTLDRERAGRPGAPWALFRNRGDGTFENVTASAGLDGTGWATGAAAADVDNDGWPDLYVSGFGVSQAFRNQGDGTFVRVPRAFGGEVPGWSHSAAFGDVDGDGVLDLAVARYVKFDPAHQPGAEADGRPCTYRGLLTGCGPWLWKGDGVRFFRGSAQGFTDATGRAGVGAAADGRGFQAVLVDLDGDGDLDLFVGCDVMPNTVLENVGGRFRQNPDFGGLVSAAGKAESAMGLAVADLDADGLPEIFTGNFAGEKNTLYVNRPPPAPQRLTDITAAAGLADHEVELDWGAALVDFDLDGRQDELHVTGHIYPQVDGLHDPTDGYAQTPRLHASVAPLTFREARLLSDPVPRWCARALAILDADGDGAPDAVIGVHNGRPRLLANAAPDARARSLGVELTGTRGSRDPLGARVTLDVDGGPRQVRLLVPHQGYLGSQSTQLFFAWPRTARSGTIAVRWPSGHESRAPVSGPGVSRIVEE